MGIDINNNIHKHTTSNKLRQVTNLQHKIIDIINEDQSLKRYLKYQTKTPLLKMGIAYDNEMIEQPDLEIDLNGYKIFDSSYIDELVTEASPYIFIANYDNGLEEFGRNTYKITILVPSFCNELDDYNDISGYTKKRHMEIAIKIIDLIDERNLDDSGRYNYQAKIRGYGRERRFVANSTEYKTYEFDTIVETMGGRTYGNI